MSTERLKRVAKALNFLLFVFHIIMLYFDNRNPIGYYYIKIFCFKYTYYRWDKPFCDFRDFHSTPSTTRYRNFRKAIC